LDLLGPVAKLLLHGPTVLYAPVFELLLARFFFQ
jgi:hypothetical protein